MKHWKIITAMSMFATAIVATTMVVESRLEAPPPAILAAVPNPGQTYNRPCDNDPEAEWATAILVDGASINGMDGCEAADFDLDGDVDFGVSAEQDETLFVAVNPGASTIAAGGLSTVVLSTTLTAAEGACWVYWNAGSYPDLVGLGQTGEAILCTDPGNGGSCTDITSLQGLNKGWMQCQAGDFDGDGDEDLIVGGTTASTPGSLRYVPNPAATSTEIVVTGRTMSIDCANMAGSSALDCLVSDREAATGGTPGVFLLTGNGDGTFSRTNLASGNGSVRMMFSIGDLNGDGVAYDFCTGVDSAPWSGLCYVWSKPGVWKPRYLPPPGTVGQWQWSWIGEINHDGYPDLFTTYDATGLGYRHELDDTGVKGDNCCVGDYQGNDGDVDFVCTEQNVGGTGVGRGLVLHINPCR
jgi:hypothetical protein